MIKPLVFALCVSVAGCSGFVMPQRAGVERPSAATSMSWPSGELFVENAEPFVYGNKTWTSVYALGSFKLLRTIHGPPDAANSGIGFDSKGNYYWEDWVSGTIRVVPPGKATPSRIIYNGLNSPWALAFDREDDLYVANYASYQNHYGRSFLSVYPAGKSNPKYMIRKGVLDIPNKIAIDAQGNLYVANVGLSPPPAGDGYIAVYHPKRTSPSRFITKGVYGIYSMKMDASGNLYIANSGLINGDPYYSAIPDSVSVYKKGAQSPSLTITNGISLASALAVDRYGTIYVANRGSRTITVYRTGQTQPAYTIQLDPAGDGPYDIKVDSKGNIYVTNLPGQGFRGSVSIYAPGATTPVHVITQGINGPGELALWP